MEKLVFYWTIIKSEFVKYRWQPYIQLIYLCQRYIENITYQFSNKIYSITYDKGTHKRALYSPSDFCMYILIVSLSGCTSVVRESGSAAEWARDAGRSYIMPRHRRNHRPDNIAQARTQGIYLQRLQKFQV